MEADITNIIENYVDDHTDELVVETDSSVAT